MRSEEFAARLAALPEEEPDELDLAMIEDAEKSGGGSLVPLEEFLRGLEGRAGKSERR